MEDVSPIMDTNRPASPSLPRFIHVKPSRRNGQQLHADQLSTSGDADPISQADYQVFGQQTERATQEVQKEVAMRSGPDGILYQPPSHFIPTLHRDCPVALTGFNPFDNSLPSSATTTVHPPTSDTLVPDTTTSVTPKRGRPAADNVEMKSLHVTSTTIIGYNEDTGSPVCLSAGSCGAPRSSMHNIDSVVQDSDNVVHNNEAQEIKGVARANS